MAITSQEVLVLLERATIRLVTRRIVPFLVLCYFLAFIDRVNFSVAALTMNRDLGFTQAVFGFGAGLFFVSYYFFEVPSNLIMQKVGARLWIARVIYPDAGHGSLYQYQFRIPQRLGARRWHQGLSRSLA
jgi:ACS family tartrate transporter-like MFS transporter